MGARQPTSAGQESGRGGRSKKEGRPGEPRFVLYVEGPRDREVLAAWAKRIDFQLVRMIEAETVILGGRRPARALSDFRKRGGEAAGWRGMVVLDRDGHDEAETAGEVDAFAAEGLDLFIWGQRHIESYLLVPAALKRVLGAAADDDRIEQAVADAVRESTEDSPHAKNILGAKGSLSQIFGKTLHSGEIARSMRKEELHPDVLELFRRLNGYAGVDSNGPEVVVRARPPS